MRNCIAGVALMVAAAAGTAAGQEPATNKIWKDVYQSVAAGFDIHVDSEPDARLEFVAEPLLFWNNKASNRDSHGAFFVWTQDGRASVISAVWSFNDNNRRRMIHEFHSFAPHSLTALHPHGPAPEWTPRSAGVEWKAIPGASNPGGTAQLRLAQMRRFAANFSGLRTAPDGAERTMRMLTTPLFRYETGDSSTVFDGAVFAFFDNWDPELMLVLEARASDGGPVWQWSAGRFSNRYMRLEYRGAEVWSCPADHLGGPTLPYYVRHSPLVFDHLSGEPVGGSPSGRRSLSQPE